MRGATIQAQKLSNVALIKKGLRRVAPAFCNRDECLSNVALIKKGLRPTILPTSLSE